MKHISLNKIIKALVAIIIVVIMVFPLWWVFCVVFSKPGVPITVDLKILPTSILSGIDCIKKVLSESNVTHAYLVSTLYTIFQVIGVIIVTSMAAYEFALFKFKGHDFLFFTALIALMMPQSVTLIPKYLLTVKLGWLNKLQGLVIPGIASAFGLFTLTQFMEDMPKELIDAAKIDGLGHFGIFQKIVLPLSKNGIVTLAILQFLRTWGDYMWPMVIAPQQSAYTVSQIVNLYNACQNYNTINVIMAVNLLACIPPIIFYLFFQKKIIDSVATSGIKS